MSDKARIEFERFLLDNINVRVNDLRTRSDGVYTHGGIQSMFAVYKHQQSLIDAKDAEIKRRITEKVMYLDNHYGTPCEQIRHAQEIEKKDAEIAQLNSRLEVQRVNIDALQNGVSK